jgi:hypothetical protein
MSSVRKCILYPNRTNGERSKLLIKEKEETDVLGLEELCSLMNINGAGLCGKCLHLGPMGI